MSFHCNLSEPEHFTRLCCTQQSGLDALVDACLVSSELSIINQAAIGKRSNSAVSSDLNHIRKKKRMDIENLVASSLGDLDDAGYVSDQSAPSNVSLSDSESSLPSLESSQVNDGSASSQFNQTLASVAGLNSESAIRGLNTVESESSNDILLAIKNADPRQFISLNISYSKCAQKSYGSEKRFLCPPPVLRSTINASDLKNNCTVSTITHDEDSSRIVDYEPCVSHNGDSLLYRHLYVSASSKAKSFKLMVEMKDRNISIESCDISMISKPSKKKIQKDASVIRDGDLISLFNRINSQTVRTRYIHHASNDPYFTAQYNSWSPIRISVDYSVPYTIRDGQVRYGSVIVLSDYLTNTTIERLVIRKIEKNQVLPDCSGPIGLMSRVCLMRESMPGVYLSTPVDSIAKRISINNTSPSSSDSESENCLMFGAATRNSEGFETLEDSMCWTLSAVDSISTTLLPLNNRLSEGDLQRTSNSFPYLTCRPSISSGNVITVRGKFLEQVQQCVLSQPNQAAASTSLSILKVISLKKCEKSGDSIVSYLVQEPVSIYCSRLFLICPEQDYAVCCPLW